MFLPDAKRARAINSSLAAALTSSLKSVHEALNENAVECTILFDSIYSQMVGLSGFDSVVYARYHDVVSALREQRWSDCRSALEALRAGILPVSHFHCLRWGSENIAHDKSAALLRCVNSDPQARIIFETVNPDDFAHLERLTTEALALLRQAAPDLVDELTELVRELVFANCDPAGFAFDGITSFYCWGALFLNAAKHCDLIALIDGLSHEGAHSYLFGLSAGAPYLVNGLGARFSSPLRSDPRPLEGIYHATFVSARMHYAQSRLLASGLLSSDHANAAEDARDTARQAFYAGMQTLNTHAEFTPLGRDFIDETLAYMRSEDA